MLCPPGAKSRGPLLACSGDVAEHQIAVARERLRVRSHDVVRSERQGLLEVRSGGRVVHGDEHAAFPRNVDQMADVAHVELRIGRRLDQQQPRSVEGFRLGVAGRRCQTHLHADLRQPVRREHPRRIVRVCREHDGVARLERDAKERVQCRHAGREADRVAAVKHSERLFPHRPRRVVEAPVGQLVLGRIAARGEGGGELQRRHECAGGFGRRIAGLQDLGIAVHTRDGEPNGRPPTRPKRLGTWRSAIWNRGRLESPAGPGSARGRPSSRAGSRRDRTVAPARRGSRGASRCRWRAARSAKTDDG